MVIINLAIFNFDYYCNFGNFQFWQLQFWQLQFWQLSILTIFNLGYFQAKNLNGAQEEQEQHINCIDLAVKKLVLFFSIVDS